MPLIDNLIEVKVTRRTSGYYRKLGYEIPPLKDNTSCIIIKVKSRDIPKSSKIIFLDFECDNCHSLFKRNAQTYYRSLEKGYIETLCQDCYHAHTKQAIKEKYGVEYGSQIEGFKEKTKNTYKERYGVEHPLQLQRFRQKAKQTCLKKYGVESYSKTKKFKDKAKTTFSVSGIVISSKAQRYICEILGGELNAFYHGYYLDILYEKWLDIEYDGSGHDLRVKRGTCTQKEFNAQERKRYAAIHNYGCKTLTIKGNSKDLLPKDEELIQILHKAIEFLRLSKEKSYVIDFSNIH